jgi:nitrate/nitrite transporter NarK
MRALYWFNFFLYLAIFGFFRCYPMYLVDEFHLGVPRVSEFIAWVGVPIVLANVWLTGFLSARMSVRTLTFWSALLTGVFMVIVVVPRPQRALWGDLVSDLGSFGAVPAVVRDSAFRRRERNRSGPRNGQQSGAASGGRSVIGRVGRSSRRNNGQAFPDRAGRIRNRCRGVLALHSYAARHGIDDG